MEIVIEGRNLFKSYLSGSENVLALNGVDLDLGTGECVALTGASGSGKSTLINILSGILEPDEGDINVVGFNYTGSTATQRAAHRLRNIGVIFQDHRLIAEFTALENVILPLVTIGLPYQEACVRAERALCDVGLDGMGKRRPKQLSLGQQQRVGIARAIAADQKVLLCDEPTGSLDTLNSRNVFALLRSLADEGRCVVIATHDPLIEEYATCVMHIQDGSFAVCSA